MGEVIDLNKKRNKDKKENTKKNIKDFFKLYMGNVGMSLLLVILGLLILVIIKAILKLIILAFNYVFYIKLTMKEMAASLIIITLFSGILLTLIDTYITSKIKENV